MNTITLNWPALTVDVGQVNVYFRVTLSSNYDGLVATPSYLNVVFKTDYSDNDNNSVNSYWNSLDSNSFNPTPEEVVGEKIQGAMDFGQQILMQFATQNVLAGITQAGKTQPVMDYCHELTHCLLTGSLYAALGVIGAMIADTGATKTSLAPFVSNAILYTYLNKIQAFLALPLTPNPGS